MTAPRPKPSPSWLRRLGALPLALPLTSLLTLALTLPLVACMSVVAPSHAAVTISQLYGGGGNSGAPFRNDIVGFGGTANDAEMAPAPAPSDMLSIVRKASGNGYQDTSDNRSDFVAIAPNPRNSSALSQPCSSTGGGGGGPAVAALPAVGAAIYTIQGRGASSPLAGQNVVTSGVVTRVNNNGFFIQDLTGDNDPATSDGIFVFTGHTNYPAAAVGNLVQVTATVIKFTVSTTTRMVARPVTHAVTELRKVSTVTQIGSGYTITPTVVTLPAAVGGDLKRFEGMLVTLTGPFTVNQNFYQARSGQLTLAAGGRLETPTNRYRPGSAAAVALADADARRRIVLDDGSSVQNPDPIPYLDAAGLPRAGYTTGALTGVIDYGLATSRSAGSADYKIHPTVAPVFMPGNRRTAAPAPVGGNVRIASFNVLNYFTAYTDGGGTGVG